MIKFPFSAKQNSIVYHTFTLHSAAEEHLGCLHLPAPVTTAAKNMVEQKPVE